MAEIKTYKLPFLVLIALLIFCFLVNISLGSVSIPLNEIFESLIGTSDNYIIQNYRLPKAITAILVGSGLGVSGLLMQTLFRNPLAGPFVLGISSGASLGVAIVILGAGIFGGALTTLLVSKWSVVIAASLGSFLVLLAVLAVSTKVRDTMAILIIGLMFGSITAAVVSVLSYFSSAEQLQQIGQPGETTKATGYGLGIRGAKNYLNSIGGALDYESEIGSGTIAKLTLKSSQKIDTN